MKKHKIRHMYTSLKSRMFSISFSVIVFILVVIGAILYELHLNDDNFLHMYQSQQEYYIKELSKELQYRYQNKMTDDEIIAYMDTQVEASGSRFFVLIKDKKVVFAKNKLTTDGLSSLRDADKFFKNIEQNEIMKNSASFEIDGSHYEIYLISDTYSVLVDGGVIKHRYYILLAVCLVSFVLVALLLTLIGSWNKTQKKLEGTKKELDIRNEKMEIISRENGILSGDKTDLIQNQEEIGISQADGTEFYNIYTIHTLLRKSDDDTLRPLQMYFLRVVMENRYYTKHELFELMQMIQTKLSKTDVMGEVRKGYFVILSYRMSEKHALLREERVKKWCEELKKEKGIEIEYRYVPEDERSAIVRFEEESKN